MLKFDQKPQARFASYHWCKDHELFRYVDVSTQELKALAVDQLGRSRSPNRAGLVLRCGRVRGCNRIDAMYNSSHLLASFASKFNWVANQFI
jgi:hypothetical protein